MNKLLSVLAVVTAFVILPAQVGAAAYHSAQWYDAQTNIGYRWLNERAAVEARIVDNHTNDEDGISNEKAVAANIAHIERLVHCIFEYKSCASQ